MTCALPSAAAQDEPQEAASEPDGTGTSETQAEEAPSESREGELVFGARARVTAPPPPARAYDAQEAREVAGAMGDPFRVLETLPSVVPVLSGLPFTYVRGAPPAGSVTYFDEVPIPNLFHLAAGPSTLHPRLLGEVTFQPGVASARYGRSVGATVVGGPAELPRGSGAEVELRLVDFNAYVHTEIDDVTVLASGRYGYPGPVVGALVPGLELAWWDYQVSLHHRGGDGSRTRILALGAYDSLDQRLAEFDPLSGDPRITLEFHRVDVRHVRQLAQGADVSIGMRVGSDRSQLGGAIRVALVSAAPRMSVGFRAGALRVRIGGDFNVSSGRIETSPVPHPTIQGAVFPEAAFADINTRSALALWMESALVVPALLRLELGLRADMWWAGRDTQAAGSPRGRLVVHLTPDVDLESAAGLSYQPAVLFLPLPGFADATVDRGLQEALQSEVGLTARMPLGFSASLTGFYHRYTAVLLPDLYVQDQNVCVGATCVPISFDPRSDGEVAGAEAFIRREGEVVTGSLSYTLSSGRAFAREGFEFTPTFDVRHVLNLVLRVQPMEGLSFSLRAFVRSGRVVGRFYGEAAGLELIRYEQRLPPFFRGDAEVSYDWRDGPYRFHATIGFSNFTLSSEPIGLACSVDVFGRPVPPCEPTSAPPIFYPSLGFRASM